MLANLEVQQRLEGKAPKKVIVVPKRIVNIVVSMKALLAVVAGPLLLSPVEPADTKQGDRLYGAGPRRPAEGQKPAASANSHPFCVTHGMARSTTVATAGMALLTMGFSQSNRPQIAEGTAKDALPLRSIEHNAFKPGEKLTYVVHYGWVNAGEAVLLNF